MRLALLGGGGFRVPLVFHALTADPHHTVDEVVLYDRDLGRLHRVRTVLAGLVEHAAEQGRTASRPPRVVVSTDLAEAVSGADFVFCAIRVGGLDGRVCDERAALDQGLLGQETTGAGGVCYGLRTVPVAVRIARAVRRLTPDAWVVNFTNPAGMVTEAMAAELGDRVVGICDSPVGLFARVARALDVDPDLATFDYAGLNHLGWLRRVLVDGVDLLPSLLADDARLAGVEEARLFGADWLRTLRVVPNEYLYYWYFTADAVRSSRRAGPTRGEYLRDQQAGFYAAGGEQDPRAAYEAWQAARRDRERSYMADSREATGAGAREAPGLGDDGGYPAVALRLMTALAGGREASLVLNVRNRGALPGLDDDAVVEVPCRVGGSGPRAVAVGPLDPGAGALVQSVKHVERTTIDAARAGSRALAVRALAEHPLVDSVTRARAVLDTQLARLPELAAVLPR